MHGSRGMATGAQAGSGFRAADVTTWLPHDAKEFLQVQGHAWVRERSGGARYQHSEGFCGLIAIRWGLLLQLQGHAWRGECGRIGRSQYQVVLLEVGTT